MANTIEAAELIEEAVEQLKELLVAQKKISNTLQDNSLVPLITHTENLIESNTRTAKYIRKMVANG